MAYQHYFQQLKSANRLLMKENDVPGFSMAVVGAEGVLFSDTYGFTDLSGVTPITPATQFSLQSISKTYLAFGFMLAVQDGKVQLDDPLQKFVPAFSVKHASGEDYSALITFRHLLKHRSGLVHEAPVGNNYSPGAFEAHIQSINGTYLKFKPDESYAYSNLGMDLAAYALSQMYGMPFEEYMREKVFEPLEMEHSTFDQQAFLLHTDSAMGHAKTSLVKYPIPMIGGGGMYSCPGDMAYFITCFLNQGVYNGKQIISPDTLRQMYGEYPASEEWPYNIGLVAGVIKNRLILNHNGGGFGFLTTQDILPEIGLGAVALTNSVEHPNIHIRICRNMWDDLLDMQDADKQDCEPLPDAYAPLVGLYEAPYNGGSWKLAVIPRNGALYCNDQKLIHHSDALFFTETQDCVQFSDEGMRYNNVLMGKRA